MGLASLTRRLTRRRAQLSIFSGLIAVCLLAIGFLSTQVFMKLDSYAASEHGNLPWALSRLEVEQLQLLSALKALDPGTPNQFALAHRRFDAFYSRANTIAVGAAYQSILEDPRASSAMMQLTEFTASMAKSMDLNDTEIIALQPQLMVQTAEITDPIRRLATFGISLDAQSEDRDRKALLTKLVQVSALSLILLLTLASLTALLWQLYRLYRQRALENRQTLNRLSTILDTSQDAVVVVHPDGSIIHTNRAGNTMFFDGQPPDETTRVSSMLKRKEPDGTLTCISGEKLLASCKDGPNLCVSLQAHTTQGNSFPVELSADTAWRGGTYVVVCFIRNISRRLADQAALLAARDKALSGEQTKARFLGAISHEMRTPLTGILGALDLLDDTAMSARQKTYAKIMQSSGQVLLNQINDALDVAQADQGHLTLHDDVFDIEQLLDTLINAQRPLAHKADNTLRLSESVQTLGLVRGDRDRVHQVLLNLVANAIKFTSNGIITLDAARLTSPDGTSTLVEFQVIDTGLGIAAEDQARIFEDFVRLDTQDTDQIEGTGLGLGIVRNLVALMGGETGVESTPGDGSLFWVRLPLHAAQGDTAAPRPRISPLPADTGPLDMLVVEDNSINRTVLAELLEADGHRVWTAENGEDAVSQAAPRRFDVILMDINMPVLDGISATRAIRDGNGLSTTARIVALSAHITPDIHQRVIEAGINAVLTKPLRREDLRQMLRAMPAKSSPETRTNQSKDNTGDIRSISRIRPEETSRVFDDATLEQLRTSLSPEGMNRLLVGFTTQGDDLLLALPTLKGEELPARLHDFAGLSATIGALSLHSCLSQAELALRAGDAEGARVAMQILPDLWQTTRARLAAHTLAA